MGLLKSRKSALEIYRDGYDNRYPYKKLNSKQFFIDLREAIVEELENQGFCALINHFLDTIIRPQQELGEAICIVVQEMDRIVYSVLEDIIQKYTTGNFTNVENLVEVPHAVEFGTIYQNGVPFPITTIVTWDKCSSLNSYRKQEDCFQLKDLLCNVRNYGQEAHLKFLQNPTTTSNTVNLLQKGVQSMQSMYDNHEGKKIIEKAQRDAKEIIDKANEKKQTILDEANIIRNNANAERQTILNDAHDEKERILREANAERQTIINKANSEARQTKEQADIEYTCLVDSANQKLEKA
ncbi:MAG: hypothetical protein IKJ01_04715, partial [Lachnospiraceae bacterium]|nr:hypothetical protein [Lachnospiraceae bacterium]